jgi:hypothetical protein
MTRDNKALISIANLAFAHMSEYSLNLRMKKPLTH